MPKQQSRAQRVRHKIRSVANGRMRLNVYKSNKHIYAQVIDDANGLTVATASTLEMREDSSTSSTKSTKGREKEKSSSINSRKGLISIENAAEVGKRLASRAREKSVEHVVFDRNGFKYHGRVAALAEAARTGGLKF